MERVQIYLSPRELEYLDKDRLRTGLSRSELIRRVLDNYYSGIGAYLQLTHEVQS